MIIESIYSYFVHLILVFSILFFGYYKWIYGYWQRKNLPHLKWGCFLSDLVNQVNRMSNFGVDAKNIYKEMKRRNWKHGGVYIFAKPTYVVIDPKYIRNVMTSDFLHFTDRGQYRNSRDSFEHGLAALNGSKWKNFREKYVSIFTPDKMKMIFQNMVNFQPTFLAKIEKIRRKERVISEDSIKSALSDLSGFCVLGSDYESLINQPVFKEYVDSLYKRSKLYALKQQFGRFNPVLANILNLKLVPGNVTDLLTTTLTKLVNHRKQHYNRTQDYLQMFININRTNKITNEEIFLQISTFFSAFGMQVTYHTLSFSLYEIAKNQSMQNKLRSELQMLLETEDKISYAAVQKAKYLKQIIFETLRKYPPQPVLFRKCVQDYKVEDTVVVIERGTDVMIPLYGIHHDEEYYPEPEKFDPDRFNDEQKIDTFMPFGKGPRSCFGMRFGMLFLKFCLLSLVTNYKFTLNEKTKEPLELQVGDLYIKADGGIWFDIQKI